MRKRKRTMLRNNCVKWSSRRSIHTARTRSLGCIRFCQVVAPYLYKFIIFILTPMFSIYIFTAKSCASVLRRVALLSDTLYSEHRNTPAHVSIYIIAIKLPGFHSSWDWQKCCEAIFLDQTVLSSTTEHTGK